MSLQSPSSHSRRTIPSKRTIFSSNAVSPAPPTTETRALHGSSNLNKVVCDPGTEEGRGSRGLLLATSSLRNLAANPLPPSEEEVNSMHTKLATIRPSHLILSSAPGSGEFFRPRTAPDLNLGLRYDGSGREADGNASFASVSDKPAAVPPSKTPRVPPSTRREENRGEPSDIDRLVHILHDSTDVVVVRNATKAIRQLSKTDEATRLQVVDNGAIPPLVRLLSSNDSETCEQCVTALLNLSLPKANKARMAEEGAIEGLVDALQSPLVLMRENAAAALFSLSEMDRNKETIGSCGAIPFLVTILRTGSEQGQKDACKALFNLSILSSNKWRIVSAGSVDRLIEIAESGNSSVAEKAVSVLANLATTPEGRNDIANHETGIQCLVDHLEDGTPRGKENAASTLLLLAKHNPNYKLRISKESCILPLNMLCQKGTERARNKATELLQLLRECINEQKTVA